MKPKPVASCRVGRPQSSPRVIMLTCFWTGCSWEKGTLLPAQSVSTSVQICTQNLCTKSKAESRGEGADQLSRFHDL